MSRYTTGGPLNKKALEGPYMLDYRVAELLDEKLQHLPLFRDRLVVLQAVWGMVEDIVLGRVLLAFQAVAALAQDYILHGNLHGSLVLPLAAGDMALAPQ